MIKKYIIEFELSIDTERITPEQVTNILLDKAFCSTVFNYDYCLLSVGCRELS